MALRASVLAVLFAVSAGAAVAQTGPPIAYGPGTRTFAEPLYWLNEGRADRVPIRERRLEPRLGFAGLATPPTKRQGLTPFAAGSLSYRATREQATITEAFAALGLGVSYRYSNRRQQVQADYYAEFTGADGSGNSLDNHGGALSLSFSPSERDRLSFNASYSSTTDLQSAPLPGAIAGATRFNTASLAFTYGSDRTRRTGYELGLSTLLQSADQGASSEANVHSVSGRFWHFLTPVARVESRFNLSELDLGANSFSLQTVDVAYTADLGPRLSATGSFGLMHTDADRGRTFARLGGNVIATARNSRVELALEREMIAVPGLGVPVLSDRLGVSWDHRIDHGWLGSVTLEGRRLEELNTQGNVTRAVSLDGQVSYAISNRLWAWGRISLSSEDRAGSTSDDTRFSIGFSRNLR